MIASLPMYDMPHLWGAHDRYWTAIRTGLGHGPETLTRGGDPWDAWRSRDLLLGQTCGLPYRARLHGSVTLLGTPDYELPDCPPGYYFSYLIRRRNDQRNLKTLCEQGVMAFNDPLSQSGWAAPLAHLATHELHPLKVLHTGAHLASISAVARKKADFAAIDAVTFLLWAQHDRDAMAALDAFARTAPTPALPYITARDTDPAPIAAAITSAISALSGRDRLDLRLRGLTHIPPEDYMALPVPTAPAELRIT